MAWGKRKQFEKIAGQDLIDKTLNFFFFREHSARLSKPCCPWQQEEAPSVYCIEDGWRTAELQRKLGTGAESALCRLSGSQLTTVTEWQGVQILNSSWEIEKD